MIERADSGPAAPAAVIFDVDGTLAHTERFGHRIAFNRAFERAGLPDRWDEATYGRLLAITGGRRRLAHYLEAEAGHPGAEAARLAETLHRDKTRVFAAMVAGGEIPPRPGLGAFLDDLAAHGLRLAVATTGRRAWVEPLLRHLLDGAAARFEVVVCGDDVERLKPDPEAYLLALRRLSLDAPEAVAVEDSRNGIAAARGAGLLCLAVAGDYVVPADLAAADLALDGFAADAAVLHDPHGVAGGRPDATLVARLHARAGGRATFPPTVPPSGG